MSAARLLHRMAVNNALSNQRLHAAVAQLDPAAYQAPRTSFFPTLHLTLCHILFVDRYYLDAIEAGGLGLSLWPELLRWEKEADFAQVQAAQRETDLRLARVVEALTEADLARPVDIQRRDRVQVERLDSVLLHLYQHQIHHRGQVHAMLSGTTVKPPQLDEFFLSEDLPIREKELIDLGFPLT